MMVVPGWTGSHKVGANCSKQSVEKGNHCLPGAKLLERRAGNAHQSAGSRVACQIFLSVGISVRSRMIMIHCNLIEIQNDLQTL